MSLNKINVLIVDDSQISRELLNFIIETDPDLKVMACVNSGEEAIAYIENNKTRPDVITMDINMPGLDGYETTRRIMAKYPIPIVVVSASGQESEVDRSFKSLEAGALAILDKPFGIGSEKYPAQAKGIKDTIKMVADIRLVTRKISLVYTNGFQNASNHIEMVSDLMPIPSGLDVDVVAIGASLGGPQAIFQLLSQIPESFSVPILIVQHITSGFTKGFVDWLRPHIKLDISIPKHGDKIRKKHIYVAPDNFHLTVGKGGVIQLEKKDEDEEFCPSIARLFRSVANVYDRKAIGVVLTGMGRDGAEDLLLMKERGAFTIAQDENSCVMFGIPKEAIRLKAVERVLPLEEIAPALELIVNKSGH